MNYEILHEGTFPMVKCHLEHGEQIKAESNAMITMSPTIDVTGNTEGGIFGQEYYNKPTSGWKKGLKTLFPTTNFPFNK